MGPTWGVERRPTCIWVIWVIRVGSEDGFDNAGGFTGGVEGGVSGESEEKRCELVESEGFGMWVLEGGEKGVAWWWWG